MICIPITGPTLDKAKEQIEEAKPFAQMYELRLDYFDITLDDLRLLRKSIDLPLIFTVRSVDQGGKYKKSEDERMHYIEEIAALKPDYFDLEYDLPLPFIKNMVDKFPGIKFIVSYHNFSKTPKDLDAIFQQISKLPNVIYKMAMMTHSSSDALRILLLKKKHENLIAMGMGTYGYITRILGPIVGNAWTYAFIDNKQQTAPGQVLAETLKDLYHHEKLSKKSAIYGLIGDPVEQSIGHLTHNAIFKAFSIDAVYLKFLVKHDEMEHFLSLAKAMELRGLSVTIPHKEVVQPHVNKIDSKAVSIGAINTLVFDKGKIAGYNTDCFGALDPIEEQMGNLEEKKALIIGAGGAAKGIAYEACLRKMRVTIVNRDPKRAEDLASQLHCEWKKIEQLSNDNYDLIINTTAVHMPINPAFISENCTVMDIHTKPMKTEFLAAAEKKGCHLIYGYKMFIHQALGQFNLWNLKLPSKEEVKQRLEKECLAIVS